MTKEIRQPRIGIYDSGVGGLSVLNWLRRDLPAATFFYCSDNLNFPYGTKPEAEIIRFTVHNAGRFSAIYGLDLLVIACNTASTIALNEVRSSLSIPVVGVVPAIKSAVAVSRSKTIGLLATPATIGRAYTRQLITDFAGSCKVVLRGSSVLVELAEQKLRGRPIDLNAVATELQPMFAEPGGAAIDTVVLGCTHFPLLKEELDITFPGLSWIESGPAIAMRAKSLLSDSGYSGASAVEQPSVAVFTDRTAAALELQQALAGFGFQTLEFPEF